MILIFTGNGKGKTSAAIGTALRAINRKRNVVIIQFLKTGSSGEIELLKKLHSSTTQPFNHLAIYSFGQKSLTDPKKLTTQDHKIIEKALVEMNKVIDSKPFLLILDEILVAIKFKLIGKKKILEIIDECNEKNIHLILTGRGAIKRIIEAADLVTKMEKIKHPFDKGTEAIEGLDY